MNTTQDYNTMLEQIHELLNTKLTSNDGSAESGLLWNIRGIVSRHVPESNTSISQSGSMIKEGMIRQSTNNPL